MPRHTQPRKNLTTARISSPGPILRNETLDLFDGVRVTWPEVAAWVQAIAPHVMSSQWRFAYYVENWNVPTKIRAAKLAGCWPPAETGSPRSSKTEASQPVRYR